MGLLDKLGISKVDDGGSPPKKEKRPRGGKPAKAGKQEKGGLMGRALGAAGVQVEEIPTAADNVGRERQETIILAWQYLRAMIDKGVKEFYAAGSSPLLDQHVERPTLDLLKDHLTQLRAQGIYWEQPKRRSSTQPQVKVIDEHLDAEGVPVQFTVQERFRDFSLFQQVEFDASGAPQVVDERRREGREVAINATVKVMGDDLFRLVAVERADHVIL